MTIDEIAKAHKIPLKHLKRLAKAGLLKFEQEHPEIRGMKIALRNGKHLSVWHCLTLIREPSLLAALGDHRPKAESQLRAIGKVRKGFGDRSHNLIFGAAILDPELMAELAGMIQAELEPGLSYHALAVRLLWDIPAPRLRTSANYVGKAITNLKNHPALADWFAGKSKPLDL